MNDCSIDLLRKAKHKGMEAVRTAEEFGLDRVHSLVEKHLNTPKAGAKALMYFLLSCEIVSDRRASHVFV